MSSLYEMEQVVKDAEATLRKADNIANQMGRLIEGRLRHVNSYTLKKLKRELKSFNIHTGVWND